MPEDVLALLRTFIDPLEDDSFNFAYTVPCAVGAGVGAAVGPGVESGACVGTEPVLIV